MKKSLKVKLAVFKWKVVRFIGNIIWWFIEEHIDDLKENIEEVRLIADGCETDITSLENEIENLENRINTLED